MILFKPPSRRAMVLKRSENTAQQIAFSPVTTIFLETVTSKVLEISTRDAPYAGSVTDCLVVYVEEVEGEVEEEGGGTWR